MICTHRLFNVEHSLYTEQSGRIVSMDEMKKVNNCAFVDAMFDIEGRIQKLNLSREETCIFAALCVMCTGSFNSCSIECICFLFHFL